MLLSSSLEQQFKEVAETPSQEEQAPEGDNEIERAVNGKSRLPDMLPSLTPAREPYKQPDPLLPPALSDLLPACGSPAALRARAASRVATFGCTPQLSCSVDHVLFALREVLGVSAGGITNHRYAAAAVACRAQLWHSTEQLLTSEFAEGEPEASWSADKWQSLGHMRAQWAQQFEQVRAQQLAASWLACTHGELHKLICLASHACSCSQALSELQQGKQLRYERTQQSVTLLQFL